MPPKKQPIIAGTLQTDPRSGGVKKSSGVNVLPIVSDTWKEVRDEKNEDIDWIIVGTDGNSKTDITLLDKGSGGVAGVSAKLPPGIPVFGGIRLSTGRFVTFLYIDDAVMGVKRGRMLMYKNGVFNAMEGCDGTIEMSVGLTEDKIDKIR